VYWPHPRTSLKFYRETEKDIPSPFPSDLKPVKALKVMENIYEVYRWEATELFNYLKFKDARFWLVPQAYNVKVPPTRTCENATNLEIEKLLKQASGLIIANKTKEAFAIVNSILMENKTHARALYTMGNLMMKRGDFSSARRAYYQSMLYDCSLRRSNPLFLKILMEQAEKKNFKIINFNQMVTNYLGKNILFEDLRKPQGIYYNKLVNQLVLDFDKFLKR
jgi:tetratricopeptide (TPR) repeat protein